MKVQDKFVVHKICYKLRVWDVGSSMRLMLHKLLMHTYYNIYNAPAPRMTLSLAISGSAGAPPSPQHGLASVESDASADPPS